jgi:FixJ family two-component response regulator
MTLERATIYVVDDDPSVRRALERLLRVRGYRVVSFASAEEFLADDLSEEIACLVLDIHLPGLHGLELQNRLHEQGVFLPIIFITGHGNIPTAVRAVKSGAVSFLTKPFSQTELVAEVENALDASQRRVDERSEVVNLEGRFRTLTARESEIFSFVVRGKLNKQTASELGIVENTVKVHRRRVMRKMHAESVAELVMMAQKLDRLPSPSEHQPT